MFVILQNHLIGILVNPYKGNLIVSICQEQFTTRIINLKNTYVMSSFDFKLEMK